MQAEDRVIHFCVELIHPGQPFNRAALQKLYFELSQTGAGYDSIEVSDTAQARFYSRRGRAQSVLLFLPDRALIIEEWADIPMSDFEDRVRVVMPKLGEARGIPGFMVHAATVRSTFALTGEQDCRRFLIERVCRQEPRRMAAFNRPIATAGLRYVFPETAESPGTLYVNIETFRHSNNEIFVEVKGLFGKQQVAPDAPETVIGNLRVVRSFITGNIYPYLEQYDGAPE